MGKNIIKKTAAATMAATMLTANAGIVAFAKETTKTIAQNTVTESSAKETLAVAKLAVENAQKNVDEAQKNMVKHLMNMM